MQLTPERLKKLLELMESVWPEPRLCPICRRPSMQLQDRIFEVREYMGIALGRILEPGVMINPAVVLQCNGCGHLMLFNAMALKLIDGKGDLIP